MNTKYAWMLLGLFLLGAVGCDEKITPAADPSDSLTVDFQSSDWSTPFGRGQELVTTHYRIYTTVQTQPLAAILPGFLEAACQNYQRLTHIPATQQRMPVYMLASRQQWAHLTESVFGRDAAPAVLLENGGYTHNGITVCWDIGQSTTLAVASHEGLHQFLHYHMKNRLPLWAEEGLATSCEGFSLNEASVQFTPDYNLMRMNDLREGILQDQWLPIEQLLTADTMSRLRKSQQTGISYYGQLYALAHFLRNDPQYAARWQAMLAAARDGRLYNGRNGYRSRYPHRGINAKTLFEQYITPDLAAFEKQFAQYARQLAKLPA